MKGTTMLDDHRRYGAATLVALVVLALTLSAALVVGGRGAILSGLWIGVAIAAADVVLLMRGVTRFGRLTERNPGARGTTAGLMTRCLAMAMLLGLAMAARSLSPAAVIAGFLLLPAALVTVGCVAIRRSGNGDGSGRRRRFAR